MTLGPQPVDVRRIAGMAAAWGSATTVKAGAALPRTEIIRASVGYPVVWSWQVFYENGNSGGLVKDTPLHVQPGLGRGGVILGQLFALKPAGPGTGPAGAGASGTPATELVISIQTDELAVSDYTICAVCAPFFWLPWLGPQG